VLIFIFYHRRRRGTREKNRIRPNRGEVGEGDCLQKNNSQYPLFLLHAFFLGCYNSAGFGVGQLHTNLIEPIHGLFEEEEF
jgi:hypothetical protein